MGSKTGIILATTLLAVVGIKAMKSDDTAPTPPEKKADPATYIMNPAPKPATEIHKPVEPVKKSEHSTAPPVQSEQKTQPPVSVYRQMPQGTTLLPSSEYLSDATNDALGYFREQSGSTINKTWLMEFAKDSAKGIDLPFTQGMIDNDGETLEVIMGVFNGVGRHAVVCLGGKEGIRSVTHMYMGATPENLQVSFSNSVKISTGQTVNLTEIANRASQCHEVTTALHKIDPNLRFILN